MNLLEHLLTALDTIRASRMRAFLTTLGVVIGVLAITLLVALGEGARQYLSDTFASLGSNVLQILPGKRETRGIATGPLPGVAHKLTRDDEIAVERRVRAVDGVTGVVNASATIRNGNRRRDTLVLGVGEHFDAIRNLRVNVGRFFADDDVTARRRAVVLGRVVMAELFGDENPLGKTVKVADAEFRVVGIMEHKGTSLGFDLDDLVYIPSTTALDLFALDGYTSLMARARDKAQADAAVAELTDVLARRHGVIDFTVVSQDDLLATVNGILATMSAVLVAIASIALVVGGIGIANIMLVSVRERTREIGVRRAVGATRSEILWQFLVEAVVIAMLGGAIGLVLGAAIIAAAGLAIPSLPVHLSGWIVATAIAFSGAVGVVAGVLPARRAANLDPVEALRYE